MIISVAYYLWYVSHKINDASQWIFHISTCSMDQQDTKKIASKRHDPNASAQPTWIACYPFMCYHLYKQKTIGDSMEWKLSLKLLLACFSILILQYLQTHQKFSKGKRSDNLNNRMITCPKF